MPLFYRSEGAYFSLEIAFQTTEIRTLCEESIASKRKFGEEISAQLRARLADLRAAERISDVVVGEPIFFSDREEKICEIEICPGWVIRLTANHPRLPNLPWREVARVKVLAIEPR